MDKKIIEKYNMFANVDMVFSDNAAIVDTVPALKAQVTVFHDDFVLLGPMMEPLQLDPKGYAKAKKAAKLELSAIGARICGAIQSYAEDQSDPVLHGKANYSFSDLSGKRDLDLQQTGDALYNLANGLAVALLPYGITSIELNALDIAANKFTLLNPQVRSVKVGNKTLRQLVVKKVKEMNNLLRKKLDASMKVMQFSHADFYTLYQNARRNYTLGVRHEQPEVEAITEKLSTQPSVVPAEQEALDSMLKDMAAKNGNGVAV